MDLPAELNGRITFYDEQAFLELRKLGTFVMRIGDRDYSCVTLPVDPDGEMPFDNRWRVNLIATEIVQTKDRS